VIFILEKDNISMNSRHLMKSPNGGVNGRLVGMDAPILLTVWVQSYNDLKIVCAVSPVLVQDIIIKIQVVTNMEMRIQLQ